MLGESDPTMSGAWAALIMAFAGLVTVLSTLAQSWWQRRVTKQDTKEREAKEQEDANALAAKIEETAKKLAKKTEEESFSLKTWCRICSRDY